MESLQVKRDARLHRKISEGVGERREYRDVLCLFLPIFVMQDWPRSSLLFVQ